MKRSLSLAAPPETALLMAGTALIAGTYGLVRLAYGLFLPDIQDSLGLTSSQAGYVSSGASVVYCLGALVGLVADRRPRTLVVGALATAALGAAAMALAPDVAVFVPAAVVSSAGAGLASPGLVGVVARNVPGERSARAQAVVNSGTGPGLVLAGALALVLLPQWRLGFAAGAVFTAAAGAAVLVLDRSGRDGELEPEREGWSWRDAGALMVPAVGALLLGAASASVWTYGRARLVDEGLTATLSTLAWMAVGLGGAATVLTAGWQAGLRPPRAWALTTAVVAGAVALLALGTGPVVAPVVGFAFGWAFVAATSALISWAAELAADRAAAATAGLFITLTFGQALGSTLVGTIADHGGLPRGFVVAAVLAVAAAACGVRRER